ncbi:hypothetical protein RUM44_007986 [Polyplax serrata]|uniref:RING-type domain-containing protein n=1 Tax=Polyplax serrata TaxID=468196 RepID=A0ABR1BAZ4_POLSC
MIFTRVKDEQGIAEAAFDTQSDECCCGDRGGRNWNDNEKYGLEQALRIVMDNPQYLLAELEDLSSIFSPLKTTSRIKYTCFNASNNFLIFGATSGGLYVFRREPCCFLQLLPNKEGAVTQVSISPNEKLIAFSTIRGIICVVEKTPQGAKHIITTVEHQNEQITSLQWNSSNNELFIGDNTGKVSIVMVSIFPTKGMFQTPSFVLMQLDSKIVQMDFCSNLLLVSTLTKCYICDTKKEIFRQVGHKLRDGEYGACIINTQVQNDGVIDSGKAYSEGFNLAHLKLFCARPGSRVWECAMDGTVISTHHFKEALAVPPRKIHFLSDSSSQNSSSDLNNGVLTNGSSPKCERINSNYPEQSFNFQKLHVLMSKFLFTYKSDGIYIFDPCKGVVVLWNNQITNIVDVRAANDVIYVLSGFEKMYALNVVPLEKLLIRLYFQKKYLELAKLCVEFNNHLVSEINVYNKLYVIHDLDEKLNSIDGRSPDGLCDTLKPLIGLCKEKAQKKKVQNAHKLKSSDIYIVGRNVQMIMEDKRLFNQKTLRPTHLNLKGRSHSVSPERLQNGTGKVQNRENSSSLPDLTNEETIQEEKGNQSQPDVEKVVQICDSLRKSEDPSDNLVFNLFDNILDLGPSENPVPLGALLKDGDLAFISDVFHSRLRSKVIFDWLETKFNGDELAVAVADYPPVLLANHSVKSIELDFKLSKLLKVFSCVLKENEIIEAIRETNMECYFQSLLKVLDIYQDSSLSSVSGATLNPNFVSSTPKLLNVAYFLFSVGQVEQCSKYSRKTNLKEMFYLMLKHEDTSKRAGKSVELIELQCHTLFLTFLDKVGWDVMDNIDDSIESYVVNCLENLNSTASSVRESSCECGFPRVVLQSSMAMFPDAGYRLVEKTWPRSPAKCLEICGKVPYLWRYLIHLRRPEPLDTVLPLILQTGEIQELEKRSSEVNDKVLESSVALLAKLKSGTCLNCDRKMKPDGETVSWTDFGMLSIKLSGPEETLELFKKYSESIQSKELNQTFYQGLIFSAIMERHKKGLRKNVINLLTGKGAGDSARVPAVSENVRRKILGENSSEKRPLGNLDSDTHHWGVKMNFKENCPVCSLPLDTKALIGEAGLIVFRCAHAFHSACLKKVNLECPVCKKVGTQDTDQPGS